ncbi:MAG: hypothetical protein WC718_15125 [Phycisphaerales bacterium]|jgi:hypothetical protein
MTKSCILSLIAGAACALPALAQNAEVGTLPFGGEIVLGADHIVASSSPIRGGYQSRTIGNVYDNVSNVFSNGTGGTFLGQCNMIGEDVSFVGSPWALPYAAPRQITGMTFGTAIITTASNANENFFVVFWNPADVNYAGNAGTGTNMITPGAVPLGFSLIALGTNNPGFIYQFTVTGLAIDVPATANGVFVQAGWLKASAGTPADWSNLNGLLDENCPGASDRGLAFGSNSLALTGGNPATVGSTQTSYARDILSDTVCTAPSGCTHSGILLGAATAATGGCVERRLISGTPAGATMASQYGYQIRLQGDIVATAPANTNLGALSDTQAPVTSTVATSTTKWYQFTLNGDATDAALQFLDIDSEGSATDVAVGFFDASGTLIGSDDNAGSGSNAQLSYGVGRRAAIADGQQYDGRSGEVIAGVYYVAVAPGGSTFGSGFTSNASANPGGAFTLNLHTNTNGTPLAPSVAPIINGIDYDALIGAPVDPNFPGGDFRQGAPHTVGNANVAWSRFTLQSPIDAAHFLDLDYIAGGSTLSADGVAYIFDSNGNIVYFSDDEGPGLLPQFSIGASGARFYGATGPFDGNTPAGASAGLPAGTYYIADELFDVNNGDLSFLPTDNRWHVRCTSGSNLTVSAVLIAGQGGGGTPCDPDVNQDGNADQGDVDYLLNVVAGGDNPTGIDPDFNRDGNVDQGDVDALINVVAGGACP